MGIFEWHGENVKKKIRELAHAEEERCATRLRNRVEAYAPVDTGRLKASVKRYQSKRGKDFGYTVFAGDAPGGFNLQMLPRRTKYWRRFAFYALWVERGTKGRFTSSGRYTGTMRAKRFMRKAINIEKKIFFDKLSKEIK